MNSFLSNITAVFNAVISWMGLVLDFVIANPALMVIVIAMPIIGFAITLFRRMVHS